LNFIKEIYFMFLPHGFPFSSDGYDILYEKFKQISWLIAGLSVAADWIGSNQNWFPYSDKAIPLEVYWTQHALPFANKAVTESGLTGIKPSSFSGMQGLFPMISTPTPLQHLVENLEIGKEQQLFIVEEVTGGGKTEAALTLAHRLMAEGMADGLFMALPTMATANAMHARVRGMYRRLFFECANPSLILTHSFSKMTLELERSNRRDGGYGKDDQSASQDCARWLADSRKKALLANVGVGTIDQVLLAVLAVRHQSLRLFGLARKVLIADEVHACDAYVHRLLCTLLRFHAAQGGNAILLSATLPQTMRRELVEAFSEGVGGKVEAASSRAYPLISHYASGALREHPVKARPAASRRVEIQPLHSIEEVSEKLQAVLNAGACACWVRNTVYDALQAYCDWMHLQESDCLRLFHARFALGDRLKIENEVLELFGPGSKEIDRRGKLLIATQVVEQSLDLDFDFMVSDLAPIDLIIQRAGRLQRHSRGQRSKPTLGVFMPMPDENAAKDWFSAKFPKGARVYDHHGQLWLTAKWLCERKAFVMPDDARNMIEFVYQDASQSAIPANLQPGESRADGEDRAHSSLASLNSLNIGDGYMANMLRWQDDATAPTRLGEPMVTVRFGKVIDNAIVPYYEGNTGHDWELSQLSIRQSQVAREDPDNLPEAVAAAKKDMPDEGRYCVLLPMRKAGEKWIGFTLNGKGGRVSFSYDSRVGFELIKGEQ
jgi:CRISPR-associated endonuclease/helicase Cas3